MKKSIEFTMNYNALKMFGRQLYSNAWSAISELVANSFDAKATEVYIYINMVNKSNAKIEIVDNGEGMQADDFERKYVIIGRNRRLENPSDTATGRKGIGKLAALYLSDSYIITSKQNNIVSSWLVDVTKSKEEERPALQEYSGDVSLIKNDFWIASKSGTAIVLNNVDLNRIGEKGLVGLETRLANHFLLEKVGNLYLCVIQEHGDKIDYHKAEKKVAINNLASVYFGSEDNLEFDGNIIQIPFEDKLKNEHVLNLEREKKYFLDIKDNKTDKPLSIKGEAYFDGIKKEYELKGWIGIHASIDIEKARLNDANYSKNKFYNPNQLRIYVRGKLANENVLPKLGLVATYANYLEGELSFDILDDNELDDIASTNRQEFSREDARVDLLLNLLLGLSRKLLSDRQSIADKLSSERKAVDLSISTTQKTRFKQEVEKDLAILNISKVDIADFAMVITNKLEGEITLKSKYKLFISHSNKDAIFANFFVRYLTRLGYNVSDNIEKTEIFYTSDGLDITSLDPLANIIKEMIKYDNTDILFFTSKNFLRSQYCMFEGGAAWSNRSVMDYSIVTVDHESIPKYLTNGKPEFCFDSKNKNSFIISRYNYNNIIRIINKAISHLNKNGKSIAFLKEVSFKDEFTLSQEGKCEKDYMDQVVRQMWEFYIEKDIEVYLKTMENV